MRQNFCARFRGEVFAFVLIALALALALASGGCGGTCDISDEGNSPEVFAGGATAKGSYASSPRLGPMLHFPGGKQYQLLHQLGHMPLEPTVFFAFNATDDRVSPCAGNSCVIRCWDDQMIWVKNDTCTEFWILVTASGENPYPVARCQGAAPASDDAGAAEGLLDRSSIDSAAEAIDVSLPDEAGLAE
jgi:hypothetical protein